MISFTRKYFMEVKMKKYQVILAVIAILSFFAATAFAAEDEKTKAAYEELIKLTEKCANNVSYTMETKAEMNGQTYSNAMKFYFKDVKNFRLDSEGSGVKTRLVVTPTDAWTYLDDQKVIMPVDRASVNIDIRDQIEKMKETSDIAVGKDGENKTFTVTEKNTKQKYVFTVDAKQSVFSKMVVYGEDGKVATEAIYKDWSFGKVEDSLFKKPEGAKEMKAPEAQKTVEAAPAGGDVKKSDTPKKETPKTEGK